MEENYRQIKFQTSVVRRQDSELSVSPGKIISKVEVGNSVTSWECRRKGLCQETHRRHSWVYVSSQLQLMPKKVGLPSGTVVQHTIARSECPVCDSISLSLVSWVQGEEGPSRITRKDPGLEEKDEQARQPKSKSCPWVLGKKFTIIRNTSGILTGYSTLDTCVLCVEGYL